MVPQRGQYNSCSPKTGFSRWMKAASSTRQGWTPFWFPGHLPASGGGMVGHASGWMIRLRAVQRLAMLALAADLAGQRRLPGGLALGIGAPQRVRFEIDPPQDLRGSIPVRTVARHGPASGALATSRKAMSARRETGPAPGRGGPCRVIYRFSTTDFRWWRWWRVSPHDPWPGSRPGRISDLHSC